MSDEEIEGTAKNIIDHCQSVGEVPVMVAGGRAVAVAYLGLLARARTIEADRAKLLTLAKDLVELFGTLPPVPGWEDRITAAMLRTIQIANEVSGK